MMKYTVLHIGMSEYQVNCHLKTLRRKLKPDNRNKRLLLKTQQRYLGEKKGTNRSILGKNDREIRHKSFFYVSPTGAA